MKKYEDEKSTIIRESIGEAILFLLNKQEFSEISICEICKKAGVGRTTYYRYYGNKNGKEDAIYQWLINRWESCIDYKSVPMEEKDNAFLNFIYSIKSELIILRNNHLLHILDLFIIYVYGPQDKNNIDTGLYYFLYSGAGLWIGLIKAIIKRDFVDSATDVKQRFKEVLELLLHINK